MLRSTQAPAARHNNDAFSAPSNLPAQGRPVGGHATPRLMRAPQTSKPDLICLFPTASAERTTATRADVGQRLLRVKGDGLPDVVAQHLLVNAVRLLELYMSRGLADTSKQAVLVLETGAGAETESHVPLGAKDPGEDLPASPEDRHVVADQLLCLGRAFTDQGPQHGDRLLVLREDLAVDPLIHTFRHDSPLFAMFTAKFVVSPCCNTCQACLSSTPGCSNRAHQQLKLSTQPNRIPPSIQGDHWNRYDC